MIIKKISLIFIFVLTSVFLVQAQEEDKPKKFAINGYVSSMQSVIVDKSDTLLDGYWFADNLLHNRLNIFWYPSNNITGTFQLRNRLMYGDQIKGTNFSLTETNSSFNERDLSYTLTNKSYFLQSKIDRLWIQYTLKNLEVIAGRQRINWGQSFAFNPNDIFNAYSYFDFDYVERPGSDAIDIKYYTGAASSVEAAIKVDSANNITAAARAVLNKWSYDFQFIGGILSESDWVGGFGWSGNIKSFGFRGEGSYFQPIQNFSDTSGLAMLSVSLDYMFANSLFIQAEALFSNVDTNNISELFSYSAVPKNVKSLAFSKASVVISASYTVNPLLSVSLSGMYFFGLNGYYLAPSISYSLGDNLDLSVFYQHFYFDWLDYNIIDPISNEKIDLINTHMAFMRMKYSF